MGLEGMEEEGLNQYLDKPVEELSYHEAMQELIALTNDIGGKLGKKKSAKKKDSDDDSESEENDDDDRLEIGDDDEEEE